METVGLEWPPSPDEVVGRAIGESCRCFALDSYSRHVDGVLMPPQPRDVTRQLMHIIRNSLFPLRRVPTFRTCPNRRYPACTPARGYGRLCDRREALSCFVVAHLILL